MKKTLSFLFAVILTAVATLSLAEAKHVRPLDLTSDSYDLNNGEFWFGVDAEAGAAGSSLTMTLYLEDRYSITEVEALKPDDTVEVNGETYTVEAVVIHGWYDSDGDGEPDTGDITVREPELAQYLYDRYETVVSDRDLVPEAYEIYTKEEFDGYIALSIGADGYCHPLVNDITFRRQIDTTEVPLPLPDNFVYRYEEDWNDKEGGAQEFLGAIADCSFDPHSSVARFKDGKLTEVWHFE
ncbi:MAG: hypothetical protein IKG87_05170 [Clostridia bacterium]|nr:hypothetical protein [Clostridia bacterium]